jgi:hypothetical protein
MSTVAEIESAIETLSAEEQAELIERLDERAFLRASTSALFQMLDKEEGDSGSQWLGDDGKTAGEA